MLLFSPCYQHIEWRPSHPRPPVAYNCCVSVLPGNARIERTTLQPINKTYTCRYSRTSATSNDFQMSSSHITRHMPQASSHATCIYSSCVKCHMPNSIILSSNSEGRPYVPMPTGSSQGQGPPEHLPPGDIAPTI